MRATQPTAYDFSEDEFIRLGYRLIAMKKFKDAIEIFKLGVEAYPRSYNTWDSLAEAYMDNGDKELAIENTRSHCKSDRVTLTRSRSLEYCTRNNSLFASRRI